MDPPTVLLLAGSTEAAEVARRIAPRGDVRLVVSLAGVTRAPVVPPGAERREGGFGGPRGLAAWLREHRAAAVLDATHPFAARISASAAEACTATGVPRAHVRRPAWRARPGDDWHDVADLAEAAHLAPRLGSRILLALGGAGAVAFAGTHDAWFLVRAIERPAGPLPPRHELVRARGPFALDAERALLEHHAVDAVVTRDSGGEATAAKLVAARERGVPVVVVRRPPPPPEPVLATPAAAVAWLDATLARRPG